MSYILTCYGFLAIYPAAHLQQVFAHAFITRWHRVLIPLPGLSVQLYSYGRCLPRHDLPCPGPCTPLPYLPVAYYCFVDDVLDVPRHCADRFTAALCCATVHRDITTLRVRFGRRRCSRDAFAAWRHVLLRGMLTYSANR